MTSQVFVPRLGATTSSVVVAQWLVAVGDLVEPGTGLALLEADKAQVVVESELNGTVSQLVIAEGAPAVSGDLLAVISSGGTAGPGEPRRLFASPLARRLARDLGIELADVRPTGPSGRVTRRDVEAYGAQVTPSAPARVARMSISLTAPTAPVGQVERCVEALQQDPANALGPVRLVDADSCPTWCPADPLPVPPGFRLESRRGSTLYVGRSARVFDGEAPTVGVTLALVTASADVSRERVASWMRALTEALTKSGPGARGV